MNLVTVQMCSCGVLFLRHSHYATKRLTIACCRRWKESKETLQTLLTQADPNDAGAQVDGASKERSQHLEQPRPVVTYMHRTGLRRSVLNAHILLTYLLSRYNVTLRVTTFEEPLFDVIELLAHTDVLIGMHGAGWTNALFMKPGATALQLLPYGWLINNGNSIRG